MKTVLALVAVLGLFATPAMAGFASGPATPAIQTPAPVVSTPQIDACYAYCNHAQSFFGPNMADDGRIRANCPEDSIARGGSTVYELVEGLAASQE